MRCLLDWYRGRAGQAKLVFRKSQGEESVCGDGRSVVVTPQSTNESGQRRRRKSRAREIKPGAWRVRMLARRNKEARSERRAKRRERNKKETKESG